jgi:hypothetical protein
VCKLIIHRSLWCRKQITVRRNCYRTDIRAIYLVCAGCKVQSAGTKVCYSDRENCFLATICRVNWNYLGEKWWAKLPRIVVTVILYKELFLFRFWHLGYMKSVYDLQVYGRVDSLQLSTRIRDVTSLKIVGVILMLQLWELRHVLW